jgi:hypothetical protein
LRVTSDLAPAATAPNVRGGKRSTTAIAANPKAKNSKAAKSRRQPATAKQGDGRRMTPLRGTPSWRNLEAQNETGDA